MQQLTDYLRGSNQMEMPHPVTVELPEAQASEPEDAASAVAQEGEEAEQIVEQ